MLDPTGALERDWKIALEGQGKSRPLLKDYLPSSDDDAVAETLFDLLLLHLSYLQTSKGSATIDDLRDDLPNHLVGRLSSVALDLILQGQMLLLPGIRIKGHILLEELGRGGMGMTFLAEHERLQQKRALKFLRLDRVMHASDEEVQRWFERFEHEGRHLARISQTGSTPHVYEAFAIKDAGIACVVMEHVDGTTLEEWWPTQARGLAFDRQWRRATELVIDLARAVGAIHELGIIHCDIKPSNIMVRPNGRVTLIDFGIAARIGHDPVVDEWRERRFGSPPFCPPEQLEERWTPCPKTDIYSTAMVWRWLFDTCATGKSFPLDSAARILQLEEDESFWETRSTRKAYVKAFQETVWCVIEVALSSDLTQRPIAAGDLINQLEVSCEALERRASEILQAEQKERDEEQRERGAGWAIIAKQARFRRRSKLLVLATLLGGAALVGLTCLPALFWSIGSLAILLLAVFMLGSVVSRSIDIVKSYRANIRSLPWRSAFIQCTACVALAAASIPGVIAKGPAESTWQPTGTPYSGSLERKMVEGLRSVTPESSISANFNRTYGRSEATLLDVMSSLKYVAVEVDTFDAADQLRGSYLMDFQAASETHQVPDVRKLAESDPIIGILRRIRSDTEAILTDAGIRVSHTDSDYQPRIFPSALCLDVHVINSEHGQFRSVVTWKLTGYKPHGPNQMVFVEAPLVRPFIFVGNSSEDRLTNLNMIHEWAVGALRALIDRRERGDDVTAQQAEEARLQYVVNYHRLQLEHVESRRREIAENPSGKSNSELRQLNYMEDEAQRGLSELQGASGL